MLTIYLGILALGLFAIGIIVIKEKKGSGSSAIDLLNNIDVDENNLSAADKNSAKESSSDFLKRLNLNEEKNKKNEETPEEKPAQETPPQGENIDKKPSDAETNVSPNP